MDNFMKCEQHNIVCNTGYCYKCNDITEDFKSEHKYNYWRGFKACLVLCVPVIVFLIVMWNLLANATL